MKEFLAALDGRSKAIWWHLCCHGHAHVTDLARVAGLDSDMEVLLYIREVINPAATVTLGEPVLEFVSCRVDPGTGEKVYYHWWLKPALWLETDTSHTQVDVFETGHELVVVVDLGNRVESCQPEVTCRNGVLIIQFERLENR